MLFGHAPSLVHEISLDRTLPDPRPFAWLTVEGAVLLLLVRRRRPELTLGACWWILFLIPTSLVLLSEPMADRRIYLASAGLALMIASVLETRRLSRSALVVTLVLGLGLATASVRRYLLWQSPTALWTEAADAAPSSLAPQYWLGWHLVKEGDCPAGIAHLERAILMRPTEPRIYRALRPCLDTAPPRLAERLRRAVRDAPDVAEAWEALALVTTGLESEAAEARARELTSP